MALRILTQINYSAGVNPKGDSGLYFLSKLLFSILKIDPDIHFYVLIPKRHEKIWSAELSHKRITSIPINLEPRLHGGSFMFDPAELYQTFDFSKYDIDVLFLNQPETAPAILNFLNRQMFHCLPAVSYIHWFDIRPPGSPKREMHKPALLGVLSGMMVSTIIGVNSQFGQDQIIKQAEKWFNNDSITSLKNKSHLLPPGIDGIDILPVLKARRQPKKISVCRILVNHRLLNYTGVRSLLTNPLPKLWEKRNDFFVHATNPSAVILPGTLTNKPWLEVKTLEKANYLKLLGKCDIVIAPHKSTHWSISTLEAISAGCVPLMNKESFFPEMIEPLLFQMPADIQKHIRDRWFYRRGNIVFRLNAIIDNIAEEKKIAAKFAILAIKMYDWKNVALSFRNLFIEAEKSTAVMSEMTPSLLKIFKMLLAEDRISKSEILRQLGWRPKNRTIAWTAFRKNLKVYASECSKAAEAVFVLKEDMRIPLKKLVDNPGRLKNEQDKKKL